MIRRANSTFDTGPDWGRRRIYLTGPRRGSEFALARKVMRELDADRPVGRAEVRS